MAEEEGKVWWTSWPEPSGRVVWSDEFRTPERDRLVRLAMAELIRRHLKERDR